MRQKESEAATMIPPPSREVQHEEEWESLLHTLISHLPNQEPDAKEPPMALDALLQEITLLTQPAEPTPHAPPLPSRKKPKRAFFILYASLLFLIGGTIGGISGFSIGSRQQVAPTPAFSPENISSQLSFWIQELTRLQDSQEKKPSLAERSEEEIIMPLPSLDIPKPPEGLVFDGVGQPPNLSPPASLNFLSLAASVPTSFGSNSENLLVNNQSFRWFGDTQMVSKVGSLVQPAPQIWISEAMAKQLNLNKWSDTARSKDGDVRRSQKPTFESICVYKQEMTAPA